MQQMFQKMDEKRKNKEQFSLGTPQGRQPFSNNDTSNDMNREKVHAGKSSQSQPFLCFHCG